MNWLTIAQTIFYIVWLLALLWILWRLVRVSEKRQKIETILADTAMKDAESVRKSVEIMNTLVEFLKESSK